MRLEVDERHDIELVGRGWWGAEDAEETTPLEHPITWVRFTSEDITPGDKDIIDGLLDTQLKYMNDGYTDIPYNFIVDVTGKVYEGRGWKVQPQLPEAFQGLDRCLNICYVGDYKSEDSSPPYEQFLVGMRLVIYGLKQFYITPQYNLINWRDESLPVSEN